MALIETLPPALDAVLKNQATSGSLQIAVATDLTLRGAFGEEWLIVTDSTLRVYASAGAAPRLELALAEIQVPATEPLIGGGALMVRIRGQAVEVLRYSNAQQRKFSRIAKYLADATAYREAVAAGKDVREKPGIEADTEDRPRCPHCHLLLREGTKVCPACLNKGKVILRLTRFIKPYWKQAAVVWLIMLLGMTLSLVPPYLTRPLMDKVLAPIQPIAPAAERIALLGWLVLGLLAAQALGQLLGILRARLLVKVGAQLSHDLRVQLFTHLQLLSLRFFDKRSVGSLLTRVTRDTESLETVLVDGMQDVVINILTLIGIGAVLFSMEWKLTLLILIPAPVVIILTRLCWRHFHSLWHRVWHYRSRLASAVSDTLSGMRVVKAFAKEHEEVERFRSHSLNAFTSNLIAEQTWATFFPLLWLIASLGSLLVWYIGGRQVLDGQMTLGTLMTFIAYLGMFYGPIRFLTRSADFLVRALTSAERVFEILDSAAEVKEADPATPLPAIRGRVEFRDVTFGYDAHKPVLKHIQLAVQPGEMIGLAGHSGAGKSTMINLICRFYDVNGGTLCVDGVNIRNIRQRDLRSQIGVVLQDTFLFNGSIADNIGYAQPGAAPEDIMAAAKAANAHDFIVAKTEGYDTRVGERGQSLSAGERQRVAIARAILHNPRILILDEATSAVDTDTEQQIQEAIMRLVKGRTTFAIAHRLSTLRNAHRLVVLKNGEIIETGSHEELMRRKGEFYRLVQKQQETAKIVEVGR